jgi:hypothetical protein
MVSRFTGGTFILRLTILEMIKEMTMTRSGAIIASAFSALFLLAALGFLLLLLPAGGEANPAPTAEATPLPVIEDQTAAYQLQIQQVQASIAARDAESAARLKEIEQLLGERKSRYEETLQESSAELTALQGQRTSIEQETQVYQEQTGQVNQSLKQRAAAYQTRRQEFESQQQQRLAQLQNQLTEATTRLQAANAQLGKP